MSTKLLMIIAMAVSFVGIIVLDIFMAANSTKGDTFSEIFLQTSRNSMMLKWWKDLDLYPFEKLEV